MGKEYEKCKNDIVHYAENYHPLENRTSKMFGLELYDVTKRILKDFQNEERIQMFPARQCGFLKWERLWRSGQRHSTRIRSSFMRLRQQYKTIGITKYLNKNVKC